LTFKGLGARRSTRAEVTTIGAPCAKKRVLTINDRLLIVRLRVDLEDRRTRHASRIASRRAPAAAARPGRPGARADEVLLTFGDMLRLRELPLESAKRALTDEEIVLYQNYEFYADTALEALQVANSAAELINGQPLFCAPETTFHFSQGWRHRAARRPRHRRAARAHRGDRRAARSLSRQAGEPGPAARPARRVSM
jgi:hypothetical protein